jgi:hypothetical protein
MRPAGSIAYDIKGSPALKPPAQARMLVAQAQRMR